MAVERKILVVDDDLELCQVIVDTLQDKGYAASFTQTAEEALEKILKSPPALILLDLEVPRMGGFVLCQKLRSQPATSRIPVIFLTVRDSEIDKLTALSLGAERYITKPFRRSHLLSEVAALLEGRGAGPAGAGAPPPAAHPQPARAAPEPGPGPAKPPAPPAAPPAARAPGGASLPAAGNLFGTFDSFRRKTNTLYHRSKIWALDHKKASAALSAAAVLLLALGGTAVYQGLQAKKKMDRPGKGGEAGIVAVNVIEILPAPFQDILTAVGTIVGGSEIELRFQTEGNLEYLNFHEGNAVRSGQVIARLDQTQTKIKMERAKSEYYRYEKLYALGGVSKDRLDEARVQFEFAQSEMAKTVLKASQDGILGDKGVEAGEFVTPQKKVGTLVSLDTVLVRIGVIEKEIDKIVPGRPVIAKVETYPDMEFEGKVENISPLIQGQSKTLTVEARIPNQGKLLLPGMFARTRIVVYEQENALSVPNDALEKTQQGYQLYVVGPDNRAEARPVSVGYVSLTHSVISGGINPGEKVIVQKPQELKDGAQVKIVDVEKPFQGPFKENAEESLYQ